MPHKKKKGEEEMKALAEALVDKRRRRKMEKMQTIIKALDKLALALTAHHHQWTGAERRLYEKAIAILRK